MVGTRDARREKSLASAWPREARKSARKPFPFILPRTVPPHPRRVKAPRGCVDLGRDPGRSQPVAAAVHRLGARAGLRSLAALAALGRCRSCVRRHPAAARRAVSLLGPDPSRPVQDLAAARRILTAGTEGKWILPLDDDCVLTRDAIATLARAAEARPWCGILRGRRFLASGSRERSP